ncbi:MAG: S8 family serine peptidase [Dehalococcoidia bacterium]
MIVVLKQSGAGGPSERAIESIRSQFVSTDLTQDAALVMARAKRPTRKLAFAEDIEEDRAEAAALQAPAVRYYPNLGIALGTVTRTGLAALRRKESVDKVVGAPPLSLIRPQRVASARLTRQITWGIEAMDIPDLWREGLNGKGVLVGHLDTGVDGSHPALKGAIRKFAVFDDLGRQEARPGRPYDTDDHGTHTAATIAGRPVNGRAVGVAPAAKLASAVVIESGNVVARVLGGLDWAVGLRMRVLSMSLGFRGYWDDFLGLTQVLRSRGVLPAFAVGNEGPGTSRSPGNYSEALSIGAISERRSVAGFSSSQRFRRRRDAIVPDLVAPGVGIISAMPGGGYQAMDGTSMATPHVAGLAALLFQAEPSATVDEVERAIFESCRRPAGMLPERGRRGLPNGPRALARLRR